jgi:hypothetical protein
MPAIIYTTMPQLAAFHPILTKNLQDRGCLEKEQSNCKLHAPNVHWPRRGTLSDCWRLIRPPNQLNYTSSLQIFCPDKKWRPAGQAGIFHAATGELS